MSYGDERYSFQLVALDENPSPAFQSVIDYWDRKCGADFAPSWKSINLMELPPAILPNCRVVDIKEPITKSIYRFFGTGIVQLTGSEMTDRTLGDIKSVAWLDHAIQQYQQVIKARKPLILLTEYMGRSGQNLCDLMLRIPLSDDGEQVTNVISFEDFGDYSDDLHDIYAAVGIGSK